MQSVTMGENAQGDAELPEHNPLLLFRQSFFVQPEHDVSGGEIHWGCKLGVCHAPAQAS